MTLHVTTFTRSHVVAVCDRLLFTPDRYIDLGDDRYKHVVLTCDDAKVAVSFCGIAGICGPGPDPLDDTLYWLTDVAAATSKSHHDIASHVNAIRDQIQGRIDYLKQKWPFLGPEDLKLAVQVCGEVNDTLFNVVIDNYMDKHCKVRDTRPSFQTHSKFYTEEALPDGCAVFLLGQRSLAMAEKDLCDRLEDVARGEDPKQIFDASVALIRAVAAKSAGTVGTNCSGLRITRHDPGGEVFDDRPGTVWDVMMPNAVVSTSSVSFVVADMRGRNL